MGVPALFRWLASKYPKITYPVQEDPPGEQTSEYLRGVNWKGPNPNGFEVDNLYLDMNGIVHPCCHPEGRPPPPTEEAMMSEIESYLDRIVSMVRPRKLIYMAVDGVAPRAKMNQQRARRFRAAFEASAKEKALEVETELLSAPFDSNCITPGTQFMEKLTLTLRRYLSDRIESCKAWKNLTVVLSDWSVPGEGEHKIMQFIRSQRSIKEYDANATHVIYGLDADLIMLTLATHELRFRILREDVFHEEQRRFSNCPLCKKRGHYATDCPQGPTPANGPLVVGKPFIFLDVAVLREYLERDLRDSRNIPSTADLERLIDDWVFLCYLIGNDFLPHLPSLDVREGAIDTLVRLYQENFINCGGYLTRDGYVYLDRIQPILTELGKLEEQIFKERREKDLRRESNRKRKEQQNSADSVSTAASDTNELEPDTIKLWESGCKDRYYQQKMNFSASEAEPIKAMVHNYVQGLCWVLAYYYQGCASWSWYYGYHYAPFASDFLEVAQFSPVEFQQGFPFSPFEQLMAVLPPASKGLLPEQFHWLMIEERSAILDFYPTEVPIDRNGKKFDWQGVVLLPFIEHNRLLENVREVYSSLSELQLSRNNPGMNFVFSSSLKVARRAIFGEFERCENSLVRYQEPSFPPGHRFRAMRLKAATAPDAVLAREDFSKAGDSSNKRAWSFYDGPRKRQF